jgi:chorismate synthase
MLAVNSAYRNLHLGWKLKLAQRQRVMDQGITTMTWTFDPLQSLNAHFNIGKLGVVSDRYYVNFYGADAPSFLHRIGTDRLWVKWLLNSRRVTERLGKSDLKQKLEQGTRLIEIGPDESPVTLSKGSEVSGDPVMIEIPGNINELQQRNSELAFAWRDATRSAFQEALASGYVVIDFYRHSRGNQQYGVYVLSREASRVG